MLKYVLCSLFVLHSTFSYGLEDTFDKPLQHTSQQEFFSNQNNCLQKAVKEHSIVYEVRQQLLIKGIQMLQLPKLNIQVGGDKLSESNLEKLFQDQSTKFAHETVRKIEKITDKFDGAVANTLILINLRAQKKLPDGSISEPQIISYFTTPDIFLSCKTLADYCEQLAILNEWTYYSNFTIAVIPKGARLQAMVGLTATQESDEKQFGEILKEVGEKQILNYTPKLGGAPQIYIAYASEYYVYDMGPISTDDFKKICVRSALTNEYSIYLPVLEFLSVKLNNSFAKVHGIINTVRKSPYYANPFSIFFSEINKLQNLFYYLNQEQKMIVQGISNMPLLGKYYQDTKAIIPYKEHSKAFLTLRLLPRKFHANHISLRHAYIAPLITRAIKIFK